MSVDLNLLADMLIAQRSRRRFAEHSAQPKPPKRKHEYATVGGYTVRKLAPDEIDALQKHVDQTMGAQSRESIDGRFLIDTEIQEASVPQKLSDAVSNSIRRCVEAAVNSTSGNLTHAAQVIGVSRTYLYKLAAGHGVNLPKRPKSVSAFQEMANWRRV